MPKATPTDPTEAGQARGGDVSAPGAGPAAADRASLAWFKTSRYELDTLSGRVHTCLMSEPPGGAGVGWVTRPRSFVRKCQSQNWAY